MRLTILVALLTGLTLTAADDWRTWLNRGIAAYKSASYREAVEDFQKSIDLSPNEVSPHLYLATAWMTQYIPGSVSPENFDLQHNAETEFNRVLQLDSNNLTALQSLASLSYQEAQGLQNEDQKLRKLDEAAAWYQRVLAVDPRNKTSYYSLGVIDWVKWYPNNMRARAQLGLRPEQPGPLTDPAVRLDLRARFSPIIADGIANLEKALEIDPRYDDAMAYMNLLIRERGDLRDTAAECRADVELADQWVHKALEAKRMKVSTASAYASAPPPPPPPAEGVRRIIAGSTLQNNLIRKVDPVYPILAKQAKIQGVVRFTAIIGKDGRIRNLQLISGHPLLVESAREAVAQWEYKPTLLNGEPVEIITTIDVPFNLTQ
jgi:TonB family protein